MGLLEPVLAHAAPFILVVFRLLGLFVLTPLLSSANVPRMVRVMIALSFAAAVYPTMPPPAGGPMDLDLVELLPLMLTEVMIGSTIGLIASIPLIALQMGGYFMGYQMGLALAQAYNPELDTQSGVLGQLLFYLGMAAFVALGGLDAVFMALLDTFETLPSGVFASDVMPLELLVAILTSSFEFALRIASPVMGVIVMILVALGFMMKTMPQINVMSVGFAAKILAGLLTLSAMIFIIDEVSVDEMRKAIDAILNWAQTLGGADA
ncbi:MAG: flagellar biosynthetic protein FliR [Phycisphaeraceae bacterium]|nr:MAG: flagellar biosynthetic protein FliR [Phycisphaeraceae bacterium]